MNAICSFTGIISATWKYFKTYYKSDATFDAVTVNIKSQYFTNIIQPQNAATICGFKANILIRFIVHKVLSPMVRKKFHECYWNFSKNGYFLKHNLTREKRKIEILYCERQQLFEHLNITLYILVTSSVSH